MTLAQLYERRAKLVALATRGVDGERVNAQRMLAAFDARHPEVRAMPPPPPKFTPEDHARMAGGVVNFAKFLFDLMDAMRPIQFERRAQPVKRKKRRVRKGPRRVTRRRR